MTRRQRYEDMFDAVSGGALGREPEIADDMIFLCTYIRDLLNQQDAEGGSDARILGDHLEGGR